MPARKFSDNDGSDRLDQNDRDRHDDRDSRSNTNDDDAFGAIDDDRNTNRSPPSPSQCHADSALRTELAKLAEDMRMDRAERSQAAADYATRYDRLHNAGDEYALGVIPDYGGAVGSPAPHSPTASDDNHSQNRPSTPPPTKFKYVLFTQRGLPTYCNGGEDRQSERSSGNIADYRHDRRSPSTQPLARCTDYSHDSGSDQGTRCNYSDDRSASADYTAGRRRSDAHDNYDEYGSERSSFDGYKGARDTHDVHDDRSCDGYDDYSGARSSYDDHGGGYDHGGSYSGDCGTGGSFGGDYGGSFGGGYDDGYE